MVYYADRFKVIDATNQLAQYQTQQNDTLAEINTPGFFSDLVTVHGLGVGTRIKVFDGVYDAASLFSSGVWVEVTSLNGNIATTYTEGSGIGRDVLLTSTTTLTEEDSGKTFYLNSATEFVVTLPAATKGWSAVLVCQGAPSGDDYTIVTPGSANIIQGKVASMGGTSASQVDGDTITMVDGTAVHGDFVHIFSDGTSFYAVAACNANGGITITQATA